MEDFIKQLSLDFSGGVTKKQMEAIVNKINELVIAENKLLAQEVNLNQEYNDPTRTFDINQAIQASKNIRRAKGMRLRFLGLNGKMVEYSYTGPDLSDEEWTNDNNWGTGIDVIDGGEF